MSCEESNRTDSAERVNDVFVKAVVVLAHDVLNALSRAIQGAFRGAYVTLICQFRAQNLEIPRPAQQMRLTEHVCLRNR